MNYFQSLAFSHLQRFNCHRRIDNDVVALVHIGDSRHDFARNDERAVVALVDHELRVVRVHSVVAVAAVLEDQRVGRLDARAVERRFLIFLIALRKQKTKIIMNQCCYVRMYFFSRSSTIVAYQD